MFLSVRHFNEYFFYYMHSKFNIASNLNVSFAEFDINLTISASFCHFFATMFVPETFLGAFSEIKVLRRTKLSLTYNWVRDKLLTHLDFSATFLKSSLFKIPIKVQDSFKIPVKV